MTINSTNAVPLTVTNLAVTIPPEVIRTQGVPVFPVLRTYAAGSVRLLALIDAREQYGIAKYGQTLLSDDGRDTPTEIVNEAIDLLAYLTKLSMQHQGDRSLLVLLRDAVAFVEEIIGTLEELR